jgi:hypothetical protein
VTPAVFLAAQLGEWIGEVGREIFIDRLHIQEYGLPALAVAVVVGTVLYLAK